MAAAWDRYFDSGHQLAFEVGMAGSWPCQKTFGLLLEATYGDESHSQTGFQGHGWHQ